MLQCVVESKRNSVIRVLRTSAEAIENKRKPIRQLRFPERTNLPLRGTLKVKAVSSIAHSHSSTAFRSAQSRAAVITGLFRTLIEKLLFEIELRRSLQEVESLNDNMLRDIGLHRGGLEYTLRHGVDSAEESLRG
jgi:uncharacterized protein YjiS (DUF1127 family)